MLCVGNCSAANYKAVIVNNLSYPSGFLLGSWAQLHLPEVSGDNVPWLVMATSAQAGHSRGVSELGPEVGSSDSLNCEQDQEEQRVMWNYCHHRGVLRDEK